MCKSTKVYIMFIRLIKVLLFIMCFVLLIIAVAVCVPFMGIISVFRYIINGKTPDPDFVYSPMDFVERLTMKI